MAKYVAGTGGTSAGLAYPDGRPVTAVWHVTPADGVLYAGVEPAGLFRSIDDGRTWEHLAGLTNHPSRPTWMAGAGGLACDQATIEAQLGLDDETYRALLARVAGVRSRVDCARARDRSGRQLGTCR